MKKKFRSRLLTAAAPADIKENIFLSAAQADSEFKWLEAAADGEGKKIPTFSMVGYTGSEMNIWGRRVVVDIAGMRVSASSIPILKDHNPGMIAGHSTGIEILQKRLKLAGKISGVGEAAQEIIALAANGFPWQASIGAYPEKYEFIDQGQSVTVNGQSFSGPITVVRKSKLVEVSFVAIGADTSTSARVAASHLSGEDMNLEQWLKAKGFDPTALSDGQRTFLKASFDAEQTSIEKEAETKKIKAGTAAVVVETDDPIIALRASRAAELERMGKIQAAAAGNLDIEAQAIAGGWDEERTKQAVELKTLRAGRPGSPGIHVNDRKPTGDILEAALCMSLGVKDHEKQYKPEVLEAAHKNYRRIGLQQIVMLCAAANGYAAQPGERITASNLRDVLHHAFLRAGFSTISLSGILGNVANKEILAGYMEEDQTWREIAAVRSVSDFKQVTAYRLLDNLEYEELAPDGRIKHGTLGSETYTRQAKTYAKMLGIPRTDIINDDLSVFDDLKRRIGRGAGKKLSNLAWASFMNNAAFFTTARGNYISGATTNLGTDGVGLALGATAFYNLKSPAADGLKKVGTVVGGRPTKLIVPPSLMFNAQALYMATAPGATSQNQFAGMYKPVVSPWLSDSAFTGYSSTAWYLMRDPSDMAAVVVSFLNGQETPTVESTDADFDQLGILFRGFHDFGADQAEYLAGVMSKGAA